MAAIRTLSQRALNRALLARQSLLGRGRWPIARALDRIAGIQAQYAPSMYVGLWSRLAGFRREGLTDALERRAVVQGTLMRSTIHLVSRDDYWPFVVAVRGSRREWWLRVIPERLTEREMSAAAARLRERIAAGPMPRKDIDALLGKRVASGVGLWLEMVRVPPSGTWERRRADLYAAAEDWIGPPDVEPPEAAAHLVRRYLAGFGPASRKDIADFTGLPPREIGPALQRLDLRRFSDERGQELVDLPRRPLPDPDTPAPVRFLPTWDATLLAHARRAQILPEEDRPRVFHTKTPHSFPTFLVDGQVAGTWRHEEGAVRVEEFHRLDRAARRAVGEEAERIAAFHT
jgi:hypothetical protein